MRRLALPCLIAALAAAMTLGCGTKGDVSLSVYALGATLTKGSNAFGAKLDGAVSIVFDLGKYGDASVRVESLQLGLYRGTAQLVPGATFELPAATTLPVDLAPGQKTTFAYTIGKPSLSADDAAALCAGPVQLRGTAKPAGQAEITFLTEPLSVAGCP